MMGRRPKHKDLIDMTAMVDIVFFLLIFFLVTSMQSIEAVINLPAPQTPASAPTACRRCPISANDPNYVVVTIDDDDAVDVDGEEAIGEQDLRAKLRASPSGPRQGRHDDQRGGRLYARQIRDGARRRGQCRNDANSLLGAQVGRNVGRQLKRREAGQALLPASGQKIGPPGLHLQSHPLR